MKNFTKILLISFVLCWLFAGRAFAHGFLFYWTTPVSVPEKYAWVVYSFFSLVVIINFSLFKFLLKNTWLISVIKSIAAVSLFFFIYQVIYKESLLLQYGHRWHMVHANAKAVVTGEFFNIFMKENIMGVLFLLLSVVAFSYGWRKEDKKKLIIFYAIFIVASMIIDLSLCGSGANYMSCFLVICAIISLAICMRDKVKKIIVVLLVNILLWALCIVPYLSAGEYAHGWAGGQVTDACRTRQALIMMAVLEYSKANNSKMPEAESFDDFFVKIEPYIDKEMEKEEIWDTKNKYLCPVGQMFDRNPKQYILDKELAKWINKNGLDEYNAFYLEHLLECPYKSNHIGNPRAGMCFDELLKRKKEKEKKEQNEQQK